MQYYQLTSCKSRDRYTFHQGRYRHLSGYYNNVNRKLKSIIHISLPLLTMKLIPQECSDHLGKDCYKDTKKKLH